MKPGWPGHASWRNSKPKAMRRATICDRPLFCWRMIEFWVLLTATMRPSAIVGRGAYSHWREYIFFSTSDGSNPNENGRRYFAVLPKYVRLTPLRGWRFACHGWSLGPPKISTQVVCASMRSRSKLQPSLDICQANRDPWSLEKYGDSKNYSRQLTAEFDSVTVTLSSGGWSEAGHGAEGLFFGPGLAAAAASDQHLTLNRMDIRGSLHATPLRPRVAVPRLVHAVLITRRPQVAGRGGVFSHETDRYPSAKSLRRTRFGACSGTYEAFDTAAIRQWCISELDARCWSKRHARSTRKRILEVGTYVGVSTLLMAVSGPDCHHRYHRSEPAARDRDGQYEFQSG